MALPSVSFIVPLYNKSRFLPAVLRSILAQRGNFTRQIIVVNDGSTDDSVAIVQAVQHDNPDIVLLHQPNAGVTAATNTGLARATGDYIRLVDADDVIRPDSTQRLIEGLVATGCGVAFGVFTYQDGEERRSDPFDQIAVARRPVFRALKKHYFHVAAALFRRDVMEKVFPLNGQLRTSQDFEITLRAAFVADFARIPDEVADIGFDPAGLSRNNDHMYHDTTTIVCRLIREGQPFTWGQKKYALRRMSGRAIKSAARRDGVGKYPLFVFFWGLKLLSYFPFLPFYSRLIAMNKIVWKRT